MNPPIVSLSPLRSAVFGFRAGQTRMLAVVCKATYTLAPVESLLADEQEDINDADDHWDDDAERSLRAPTDLVPTKPRAEVMLVGSAFAPGGAARSRLTVRVIVGEVDKALAVVGDHAVLGDGTLADPARFSKMALRYERAAGGAGTVNPVGVGHEIDGYGKRHLPNIVPVDAVPSVEIDAEPVGLGPIAPRWPLRAARLGSAGLAWALHGDLEAPCPEDFDASFFLSAPWDQRLDALRPNERIVLENLHPSHARLTTNLPGIEPRVFVDDDRGTPHELTLRCDTLWIDTDRGIATLTWRGQLPAEHPRPNRIVVASSSSGRRLSWNDVAPLVPGSRPPPSRREAPPVVEEDLADATAPLDIDTLAPALPFVGSRPPPPPSVAPPSVAPVSVAPASVAPPPVVAPRPAPSFLTPSIARPPLTIVATDPAKPAAITEPANASRGGWSKNAFGAAAAIATTSEPGAVPDLSAAASAAAMASNAAAGAPSVPPASSSQPRGDAAAEAIASLSPSRGSERTFVDVLWFDAAVAKRLRAIASFKAVVGPEMSRAPRDPGKDEDPDLLERRDITRALTGGAPLDGGEGLRRAVDDHFADPTAQGHPLLLVGGDLTPSFDEIATLKAAVQTGNASGSADKRLRDLLAIATEALKADPPPSRETALGLVRSILDAASKGGGPPIKDPMTRLLLDQRAFRKRHLFGEPRVRAEITLARSAAPIPVYLPAAAEAVLPCLGRLRVRLLAELRPQEDYAESVPESLLCFAFGRVLSRL